MTQQKAGATVATAAAASDEAVKLINELSIEKNAQLASKLASLSIKVREFLEGKFKKAPAMFTDDKRKAAIIEKLAGFGVADKSAMRTYLNSITEERIELQVRIKAAEIASWPLNKQQKEQAGKQLEAYANHLRKNFVAQAVDTLALFERNALI